MLYWSRGDRVWLFHGDCRDVLPTLSLQNAAIVTSPHVVSWDYTAENPVVCDDIINSYADRIPVISKHHFYPEMLERMIGDLSCDTIIDPFCGSGTTGIVALQAGKKFIGIDVDQLALAQARDRFLGEEDDAI
jgi:hypothetical protein